MDDITRSRAHGSPAGADRTAHRPSHGEGRWDAVPVLPYKEDDRALFRSVSRQVLFSDPALAGELRYFEVAPGGYSTLERHAHMHAVMVLRGTGRCLVGGEVRRIAPHDLVTVPPWTWHQFRATAAEPLGFLCLVNAERDKPQLPSADDLAALRAEPEVAAFLDGTVA
jgi:S-methyl-1-thioxylulose 5-phosphate methylthiotransferase